VLIAATTGCDSTEGTSSADAEAPVEEAHATYPCTGSPISCTDAGDAEGACWPDWLNVAQLHCEQTCSCGAYDVVFCYGTNLGTTAYYDHDSGHVLATIYVNGFDYCTGPASFVAPNDCDPRICAADASADAPDAAATDGANE
jgi:hypothetical protein